MRTWWWIAGKWAVQIEGQEEISALERLRSLVIKTLEASDG